MADTARKQITDKDVVEHITAGGHPVRVFVWGHHPEDAVAEALVRFWGEDLHPEGDVQQTYIRPGETAEDGMRIWHAATGSEPDAEPITGITAL